MERKRLLCGFLFPLRERTGEGDIVFSLHFLFFFYSDEVSRDVDRAFNGSQTIILDDKSQGALGYILKAKRVIGL